MPSRKLREHNVLGLSMSYKIAWHFFFSRRLREKGNKITGVRRKKDKNKTLCSFIAPGTLIGVASPFEFPNLKGDVFLQMGVLPHGWGAPWVILFASMCGKSFSTRCRRHLLAQCWLRRVKRGNAPQFKGGYRSWVCRSSCNVTTWEQQIRRTKQI